MSDQPKRNNFWMWAALVLLAALAYVFLTSRKNKQEYDESMRSFQQIAKEDGIRHLSELATQDTIIASLKHERDSVVELHGKTQGQLKASIKALKTRYKILHDTVTMTLADTIIIAQDSLIVDLEAEKSKVWQLFRYEIDATNQKARVSENYAEAMEKLAYEQNAARAQDHKKWRRQRTRERIVEGLIVIGVVILSL
jgi:hypothetical protein